MDIFQTLFYIPIINILIFFYRLFSENLGLALILVAIISRAITIPLTNKQIKAAVKNKEFQKKYEILKKKYKKNKEKLTEEATKLQAKYLPSQLGGCLPTIFQIILFLQIYRVLDDILRLDVQAFNDVAYPFLPQFPEGTKINGDFLGGLISLINTPANVVDDFGKFLPYGILLILVVISQYVSTKILSGFSFNHKDEQQKENREKKKKKRENDEPDFSDIMQATSKQMTFVMPVMIGLISYNVPTGLTLYWTAQSTFVIIQNIFTKRKEFSKWFTSKFNSQNGITKQSKKNSSGSSDSTNSKR